MAGRSPPILSLTGARFFACLFVVVFHTEYVWLDEATLIDGPIRNIMKSGFSGVGFFFILSGFVLAYRYGDDTGRVGLEAARTVVESFSVRANQEAYLKVLDGVFRREKGPDREGET